MAEGQGSYKVGFKRLYVGVFNPEATKVVKRMTWEDEKGGTVDLNITGLAPDLVDMFASNKRVWMKKQGTNEVKSDMSIFNIPSDDLNTVIGRTKDKNGTSWVGENTRAPYVTVIGESEDGLTGQPVYVALLKGTFSLDSIEFKTRGEKAEAPEPTKLTGDWMNRKVDVDGTSQGIVYGYHEGKEGEAEFFKKYSLDTRTVKIIQRILQVRYPANPQNVEVAVNSKSATVSAE
ncbi:major tail protein [Staphylococcus aureus]|nr:major tail protein [Staphylococcus aureus]